MRSFIEEREALLRAREDARLAVEELRREPAASFFARDPAQDEFDRQAIIDHLRRGFGRVATGLIPSQAPVFTADPLNVTNGGTSLAAAAVDQLGLKFERGREVDQTGLVGNTQQCARHGIRMLQWDR